MIVSILLGVLLPVLSVLFFSETTAAGANTGGYLAIPEVVRDLYSKEIMFQAQPRLRFLQFAKVRRDLQAAGSGKSIVFVKYNNLEGGGELAESDVLTPVGMGASEIIIPVKEQGNAIQVTQFLVTTSLMQTMEDASLLLANNMAIVLDTQFRDTVLKTSNAVFGGGKASASALAIGDGLDTTTVKDAIETLATNNSPRIAGDYYVCFAHPHQLRQMRDDPHWINANTYMGRRQLYIGEVGMYEGCVFIETTQMPKLDATQMADRYGAGIGISEGYEAVFIGENAYAWAVALDVELRDDGVIEFGRKHSLGWYGIWGMGIIEEKNIVKALTA